MLWFIMCLLSNRTIHPANIYCFTIKISDSYCYNISINILVPASSLAFTEGQTQLTGCLMIHDSVLKFVCVDSWALRCINKYKKVFLMFFTSLLNMETLHSVFSDVVFIAPYLKWQPRRFQSWLITTPVVSGGNSKCSLMWQVREFWGKQNKVLSDNNWQTIIGFFP